MNWKNLVEIAIGALIALVVFEMFVKKMVTKSSFESDFETEIE